MKKLLFICLLLLSLKSYSETSDNTSVSSFYKLIKETPNSTVRLSYIKGLLEGIASVYSSETFRNEDDREFRNNVSVCLLTSDASIIEDIFVKKYLDGELDDNDFRTLALYRISIEYCIKKEIKKKNK